MTAVSYTHLDVYKRQAVRLLQIDCKRPRRRDLPALGQMQRSMEPLLTQQIVFKGQREFLRDVLCNIRRFVVIHIHIERMRSVLHQERVCKGASIVPCVPDVYKRQALRRLPVPVPTSIPTQTLTAVRTSFSAHKAA